jgi:hypothetical protein
MKMPNKGPLVKGLAFLGRLRRGARGCVDVHKGGATGAGSREGKRKGRKGRIIGGYVVNEQFASPRTRAQKIV